MVIGGQAVLLYGEPRLTKDIDITLGTGIEGLGKIIELVKILSLKILIEKPEDFVKKTMVLPVIDKSTNIRVDFIFSFSLYERQALKRSVIIKINKIEVKFASLEDVVVHKVISGRPRDIEDINSILLKNPSYDKKYIENWLKVFDKSLNENLLEIFRKILKKL
jgi:hypothetical protein